MLCQELQRALGGWPERLHRRSHLQRAHIVQLARLALDHLAKLDLHPLLDEKFRSNIAVNFQLPAGLPYSVFAKQLEARGYYCLYGIPGDQSHFLLSTIGHLTDADIRGVETALSQVFAATAAA